MKRLIPLITLFMIVAATSCAPLLEFLLQPSPVQTKGIITSVVGCDKIGHKAIITLEIINCSNFDEKISISRNNIKLYDNVGHIYDSRNSTISISMGGGKLSSSATEIFPQRVPIIVRIEVNDVASNAYSFRSLEIGAASSGRMGLRSSEPIAIHNITWIK